MGKRKLRIFISVFIILTIILSTNIYASNIKVSNYNDLENLIIKQFNSLNTDFDITYSGSIDDVDKAMNNVLIKDPYLKSTITSVEWTWTTTSYSPGNYSINIKSKYNITKSQRIAANNKIDSILSQIIKPYMTDHEKIKAVNDYIVLNSEYDLSLKNNSDYELLTTGKSVCNGYAILTYNMLKKLDIPVNLVFGSSKGQLHVWNLVKLGDYWYHLDTTWNDPTPDRKNVVSYKYYMLTDDEIKKDHVIDKNQNLPVSKYKYYDYLKYLSLSSLNSHTYKKLLRETRLDIYNIENTAETTDELKNILNKKVKNHPAIISVRVKKNLDNDSLNSAMSAIMNVKSVAEIGYDTVYLDNSDKYNVLNIYVKYKETPDKIITDLSNNVYNTATKVNFNIYALYGSRKENITDSVLIYPYDDNFMKIEGNSLTFKNAGVQYLTLEYEGVKAETKITAINALGFNYITDTKSSNPVNVKIFDKYIDFEVIKQWPFIESGRTLVPLRAVFEVLNCEITWDATSRSAVIQQGNTKIVVQANSKNIYVNGTNITLDVPARIVNNRIMVPLRFISESLNKTVIWDNPNSTVIIY